LTADEKAWNGLQINFYTAETLHQKYMYFGLSKLFDEVTLASLFGPKSENIHQTFVLLN
jgi:hypothetical protein